jgi:nucleotide-binding universal stress UspA family protein
LEEFTPDVSESVRRSAELADSLGVPVERLRIRSPRPVRALLELARERRAGLLVFGPDRRALKRQVYDRAVRSIKDGAACLVWIAPAAG